MTPGNAPDERAEPDRDSPFDPGELFKIIERDADRSRVLAAMRQFMVRADAALFERAVAVYVRSARALNESVETVLATLESLADELERDATPGYAERDTPLRHLVLRGVLLAFYGPEVVEREEAARGERIERRNRTRTETGEEQ